jgi:hypothetical protein
MAAAARIQRIELHDLLKPQGNGPQLLDKQDLIMASQTADPYFFLVFRLNFKRGAAYIITYTTQESRRAIILLYAATLLNLAKADDARMNEAVSSKICRLPTLTVAFGEFIKNAPFNGDDDDDNLVFLSEYAKYFAMIHIGEIPLTPFALVERAGVNTYGTAFTIFSQIVNVLTDRVQDAEFLCSVQHMADLIGQPSVSKNELMRYTLHQLSQGLPRTAMKPIDNASLFLVFLLIKLSRVNHGLTVMHEINVLARYATYPESLRAGADNQDNEALLQLSRRGYTIGQTIMWIGRDCVNTRFLNIVPAPRT